MRESITIIILLSILFTLISALTAIKGLTDKIEVTHTQADYLESIDESLSQLIFELE